MHILFTEKNDIILALRRFVLVYCGCFLAALLWPAATLSAGAYDGLWMGNETANVPSQGISETGLTFSLIYQDSPTTLQVARQDFVNLDAVAPMQLIKQGNRWELPAPITEEVFGIEIEITSFYLEFSSTTRLQGSYTFQYTHQGTQYAGNGNLNHDKQSCSALGRSSPISNLSGAEGSLRCYQLQLPVCATDYRVTTRGGSGDADLHVAYGKPDFPIFSSQNDNNNETVTPSALTGLWYVGVEGFEAYSGLTLEATYTLPDQDGDGVLDCVDGCPGTGSGDSVDANGCSQAQARKGAVITILNWYLLK